MAHEVKKVIVGGHTITLNHFYDIPNPFFEIRMGEVEFGSPQTTVLLLIEDAQILGKAITDLVGGKTPEPELPL